MSTATCPGKPEGIGGVGVRPTYATSSYWDHRYEGGAKSFDWFFNYPALKRLLQQFLPTSGKVLHIGCGNSSIQEGMASDGFMVTNVDISPVVIENMRSQHASNSSLEYMVADCREMPQLASGSFRSCIDKGTLDAVLCGAAGQGDAHKYLQEIQRVLEPEGAFLLISVGAPSARLNLLQQLNWKVEVMLLPKPLLYIQSDVSLTGRPLPAKCAANKDEPIEYLGPWLSEKASEEVAGVELRDYFFAYLCTQRTSCTGGSGL